MNTENTNNIETIESIKTDLNPKFSTYIEERMLTKWKETSAKESFIEALNKYTYEEKAIYRDYIYSVVNPVNWMNNIDFPEVKELRSMDRLEIYAWVCNNVKLQIT